MIHVGIEKNDRKEGWTFCKSLSKVTFFFVFLFLTQRRSVSFHTLVKNYCFIDIGLIRGLAGCVSVNNWNPLRAFVVQMSSVYAPRRDDVDNQPIFLF